jgi:hypothetical protein
VERALLAAGCNSRLSFDLEELTERFARDGMRPASLPVVMNEMLARGALLHIQRAPVAAPAAAAPSPLLVRAVSSTLSAVGSVFSLFSPSKAKEKPLVSR